MRKVNENGTLLGVSIESTEVQGGDRFGYKVIAVIFEGWNGWCAYRGPTDWDDKKVAEYGEEVSYKVAKELFPTLAKLGKVYSNC